MADIAMNKAIGLTLIVVALPQLAAGQTYVTGRVIEAESDQGIQGALVGVLSPADPINPTSQGYTDETGSFNVSVEGLWGFTAGTHQVYVHLPDGFEILSTNTQEIYIGQAGYTYLLEDFLAVSIPLTSLEGYVLDAEMRSGIAAPIQIRVLGPGIGITWAIYTDETGFYSLSTDHIVTGIYSVVLDLVEGYDVFGDSSHEILIDKQGLTYSVPDFLVTPHWRGPVTYVAGSVTEADTGRGIPGAEIEVYGPDSSVILVVSGVTDELGNFRLPVDEAGFQAGTYTVWARHADYYPVNGSSQDVYVDLPGNAPDFVLSYGPVNFEMAPNTPPVVDAGPDTYVAAASMPQSVQLNGTAYDPDNFPDPLDIEWSRAAGPGSVTFDDDSSAVTMAHFSVPGVYSLTLTADDGLAAVSDEIQITVGQTPTTVGPAPLAHWKLDEGSGLMARDSSGNGHDATLVGSPRWVDGPAGFGNALAFNGDDYVEIAEEAPFDLTDALTVATWVNIERITADWTAVLTKGNSAWRLSTFLSENRFHFAVTGPDDGLNWIHGDTRVGLGEWHHVTGTYDGVAIRLYVDGVEDPAGPVAYSGPIGTNDFPVRLADNAQVPGWGLIGKIDDVRIYDCALDPNEIRSLMGHVGTMSIREVIDNGFIDNQDDCRISLESGTGTIFEYDAAVLDLLLSGNRGHFTGDAPFAVIPQGFQPGDHLDLFCLSAEGTIRIPVAGEGRWTFNVFSDDGFTLEFPGHDFLTVANGQLADLGNGIAMQFFGNRVATDTLGTINLPAGDHSFRLTYHQNFGTAGLEFSAAKGIHTSFDSEAFRLVGQPDIGVMTKPGYCDVIVMETTRSRAWFGGSIDSLADAVSALSSGQSAGTNTFQSYSTVNHSDKDFGNWDIGSFAGDIAFPNLVPGQFNDNFAVRVTGLLDIPKDGTYQFGFDCDFGGSLQVSGQMWKSIVADGAGNAVISGDQLSSDGFAFRLFTAGEIELTAGCHPFEAVMYAYSGGAFFELFGRGVSDRGIPDPAWHPLKAGGAQSSVQVQGLQLVKTE